MQAFEQAATLYGLTINTKKTVTLNQPPHGQTSIDPHVEIYGTPLKSVKNFTYLGSTVASDNTIDVEINNRIQAASGGFGGLWKRVWSQHGISVSTKCKMYKAIVLPTLLYSAETYTLCRRHFRKLSKVHLRAQKLGNSAFVNYYLQMMLHLTTPLMWKLTTVFKLPLERLEDCGSVYGHSMVFQFPQSARCTRQLCFPF